MAGGHPSGIASFIYCEGLHGAFTQHLDVIQETGGGHNVGRPYDDLTGLDRLSDLVGTAGFRVADSSNDENDEARATPPLIL